VSRFFPNYPIAEVMARLAREQAANGRPAEPVAFVKDKRPAELEADVFFDEGDDSWPALRRRVRRVLGPIEINKEELS
jgi:hypothetical protein